MENDDNKQVKKPPMTDEERLALAAKLDKDLDDFIENLPKRQPSTEPLDENWLEEFDKHPFFMKKVPEPGEELHPLYEGLQQLKYDPNENTPEELALSYKEDGNFNFKHKNYRLAVIGYSEGIKVRCGNAEIEASLYNNRSAAHWFLQNYRSSLRDAESALKYNPNHEKAMQRAANCCLKTQKFDDCIKFCDRILDKIKNADISEVRKQAVNGKKAAERNERKKQAEIKKKTQEENMLIDELSKLGVKFNRSNLSLLQPQFAELEMHHVHLNKDKILIWPVVFMYPEHKTMDFVQQFPCNSTFQEQLELVFDEKPAWDQNGEYKIENLNVYYEYDAKKRVKRVGKQKMLSEVLQQPSFVLTAGTPCFLITVSGSEAV